MSRLLWTPPGQQSQSTAMHRLMDKLNTENNLELDSFRALHRFSIDELETFWDAVWDFCDIKGSKGGAPIIKNAAAMPGAQFFPNASLNYAENLLVKRDDSEVLVFRSETGNERRVSWAELYDLSSKFQKAFIKQGIASGDRIAAIMPNCPETIAAMLGAVSIGAIWSTCSPDFGTRGILDRFAQIEPKMLIACDGYDYNGKVHMLGARLGEILSELPSVEKTIIIPFKGQGEEVAKEIAPDSDKVESAETCVYAITPGTIEFTALPFNHPLYILYSSGTTGAPKCITHSHGGTLLQHVKEQQIHGDLGPDSVVYCFTTCGWMMWNWLASCLASGAKLLLFEGSPFYPSNTVVLDYLEDEKATFAVFSAKYLDALRMQGLSPKSTHDLTALTLITSTGSPLSPEGFDYVVDELSPGCQLGSMSGGTDLIGCFIMSNPMEPVYSGEIQGPALGMAVDVFDDNGQPMPVGKGELVCTKPFPSMPVGFWGDAGDKKYHAAYFEHFDNIWHHGDFAEWTQHGGMIIHGRSDATLNPGGVRIGTAEIYAQVEQLDEIDEAIVIGQQWDDDVRIVLFVIMADGASLDDELIKKIKAKIRTGASPRHVPAKVIAVPDIPRTKTGKITELAVRDIVEGREIKNREALANPEALDLFKELEELKS